jgi:hypothetical protein
MTDYLAGFDEDTRARMAGDDPRDLSDDKLNFESLGRDTRRDKIINNARREIRGGVRRACGSERHKHPKEPPIGFWWLTVLAPRHASDSVP